MKASGNGEIKTCVKNLLRIIRGEVPYERLKGMDPRIIDKPRETARPLVQQDVRWQIETYEPRAEIESIKVTPTDSVSGGLLVSAKITGEEEVSNG